MIRNIRARLNDAPFLKKVIKFSVVGVISSLIYYGVFLGLYEYGTSYRSIDETYPNYHLFCSFVAYVSGLVLGYLLNRNWTFGAQTEENERYFFKYIFVYMSSLLATLAFNHVLVNEWSVDPKISNILVIGVTAVMNFLGTNFLVFKGNTKPAQD